jgi:hypothetical protein
MPAALAQVQVPLPGHRLVCLTFQG